MVLDEGLKDGGNFSMAEYRELSASMRDWGRLDVVTCVHAKKT
jgi:hypothetical protein